MLESVIYNWVIDKININSSEKKQLEKLQKKLDRLIDSLMLREEETSYKLEDLGLLKIELFKTTLKKFKNNYSKINNIDEKKIYLSDFLDIDLNEEFNLEESIEYAMDIFSENNHLTEEKEWFKKLFFPPIFNLIDKANKSIQIKQNIKETEATISNIETKMTALQVYYDFATDVIIQLKKLKPLADKYNDKMEQIINRTTNYQSYSREEKEIIVIAAAFNITIKNICETPIIYDGRISKKLQNMLDESDKLISKIKEIKNV